ncbi:MAG TPA: glycosyltransferase family 2 protein [Halanaerobiales bacterium]|nr:glycosyltransferase family 2 protein [Halanaerobiales bacterium]HPZ63376.1 glycosyltransferase family 2 protein [Halanaerobiales bacterium]HQD03916.1 glycosyltransferase family 2 protein [Halanaerobiales bacterium]
MLNKEKISVIIPAYNEGSFIAETLDNLRENWIDEIIVVNDGSEDDTSEIIKRYPVKLIDLKKNQGKGKAIWEGIRHSRGDILIIVDADLGSSVREIKKLVQPILNEDFKLVIGILPIRGGGRGFVRKLAEHGLRYYTGKTMKAPLSGQRAFRREVLEYLLPFQEGFALEMGMNIQILKNNLKFTEVECLFEHRVTGKDLGGYLHRWKQFKDILLYLWRVKC